MYFRCCPYPLKSATNHFLPASKFVDILRFFGIFSAHFGATEIGGVEHFQHFAMLHHAFMARARIRLFHHARICMLHQIRHLRRAQTAFFQLRVKCRPPVVIVITPFQSQHCKRLLICPLRRGIGSRRFFIFAITLSSGICLFTRSTSASGSAL